MSDTDQDGASRRSGLEMRVGERRVKPSPDWQYFEKRSTKERRSGGDRRLEETPAEKPADD